MIDDTSIVPTPAAAPTNAFPSIDDAPLDSGIPEYDETLDEYTHAKLNKLLEGSDVSQYLLAGTPGADYRAELAQLASYKDRRSGFANLDAQQLFYPGLYALGAISSLGKTTFALQLADQMAEAGNDVLYFSLEQSRMELINKSLSRRIYLRSLTDPTYTRFSATQIRNGEAAGTRELDEQINEYANKVNGHLHIISGNFDLDVDTMISAVRRFVENAARDDAAAGLPPRLAPVVIIDYLQIIAPHEANGRVVTDQRAVVDYAVHRLKSFQTESNTTILLISSLNRSAYLYPVDYESFKESGGVEYTTDVLFALQFTALSSKKFLYKDDNGRERNTVEKREMIKEEKRKAIRKIDLVALKNRYGIGNYSVSFRYVPKYDVFEAVMKPFDPDDDFGIPDTDDPFPSDNEDGELDIPDVGDPFASDDDPDGEEE